MTGARDLAKSAYRAGLTHRAVPFAVAKQLVKARADHTWKHDPLRRAQAIRHMRFLLGCSARAHEVEEIARRYVFETHKRSEMRFRPWLITRQRIDGLEVVRELEREGRGVIINLCHHGQTDGAFASLGYNGIQVYGPSGPAHISPTTMGHQRRHHLNSVSSGAVVFPARGSYPRLLELLREGRIVALASDLPGNTRTTFLGRRIQAASGAARLALDAGAPLVPMTSHRDGWGQTQRFEKPLEPQDFGDVGELQDAIFRSHEPAVLEWPEAVHTPLKHWKPGDPADYAEFGLSPEELAALTF